MSPAVPSLNGETRAASEGRALAGFYLSGFLFALLGAILPAWGYYRDPPEFATVGNYFLSLSVGVMVSPAVTRWLKPRHSLSFLLALGCGTACASLLYLAAASPPTSRSWRMMGLAVLGLAAGLLNTALFHAISASYHRGPAAAVNRGGVLYGLGCLTATLLVAGTYYAYTVPSILIFMAVVPGYFAGFYAKTRFRAPEPTTQPTMRQALRDFRSPGALLFALLLFFQFGNEWSIAGWLPLFLVRRLGISPKASLLLLAIYWLALLVGRSAAVAVLSRVRHGRLLIGSVLAAMFGCFLLFSTNNLFGAAMGTLLVGTGFATVYPLVAERIGRRFPYYHPGFFNGIFSFALLGGMLAPATLGYFAALWGIGVVMALPLLGTCMVFALLLLIQLDAKVTGR